MKNNNNNAFEAIVALLVFVAIGVGIFLFINWLASPKEHKYNEWDRAYVQKRNETNRDKSSKKSCFEFMGNIYELGDD